MITLFENLFDREIINLPSGTGGNFFLKEPARPDYLDILFKLEVYRKGRI